MALPIACAAVRRLPLSIENRELVAHRAERMPAEQLRVLLTRYEATLECALRAVDGAFALLVADTAAESQAWALALRRLAQAREFLTVGDGASWG